MDDLKTFITSTICFIVHDFRKPLSCELIVFPIKRFIFSATQVEVFPITLQPTDKISRIKRAYICKAVLFITYGVLE